MKKYKLIKEYPGSYKIGYTTIQVEPCPSCSNYPEFWQPVVEKDYEILSYRDNNNNIFREKDNQGILHRLDFKIHSVKRLSDSQIFTIGDIVKCEDCKGKITTLEIYGNDIYLNGIDNKMPFGFTLCNALDCFEIPQKVKQPLFTTEDGVDIFENDTFVIVNKFDLYICNSNVTSKAIYNKIWDGSDGYLQFSTKEKAEEYIMMNKPLLSLNDVLEFKPTNLFYTKLLKRAQKLNNKN